MGMAVFGSDNIMTASSVEKKCTKCGEKKGRSEFYKDARLTDGLRRQCKACYNKASAKYDSTHKEERRLYGSGYSQLPHVKEAQCIRAKKMRELYPEKYAARLAANRAKRAGRLNPPETCNRCPRDGKLEMHHEDYSKPLEVEWLCKKCHNKIRNTQAKGAE